MRLDNGATDRQSHSDALRFRGEKRLKDAIDSIGIESNPRILNLDQHTIRVLGRFNHELPGPANDGTHRIEAVHGEIDQYLLQLHSVAKHDWEINRQIEPHLNVVPGCLIAHEEGGFSNHMT